MVCHDVEFEKLDIQKDTYALIGSPVGHSLSDILHKKVFELKRAEKDYLLIEPHEFDRTVKNLKEKSKGFNVTVPFKSAIIPFLDKTDGTARDIGAVNTVYFRKNKWYGTNTDYQGFLRCLNEDGIRVRGKKALIIGYGGVARMIAYALLNSGADVDIYGRNRIKAESLINDFKTRLGFYMDFADVSTVTDKYSLLFNATPVGMYPETDGTAMDISGLNSLEYVFDTIYNPAQTNLLKAAAVRNIKNSNGLRMLVYQGLLSEKFWNGYDFTAFEEKEIIKAVKAELFKRKSASIGIKRIFLTGFMGSGKSTAAKELADALNWKTYDTDTLFSEKNGNIPEFFKREGEEEFRRVESEILKETLNYENAVISTGGGITEREENRGMLSGIGNLTFFLDCPFEIIQKRIEGTDRPNFQNIEKAIELYKKRLPFYKNCCNIIINADDTVSNIICSILD